MRKTHVWDPRRNVDGGVLSEKIYKIQADRVPIFSSAWAGVFLGPVVCGRA